MRHGFSKKAAAVILAATVVVSGYAGAGYVLAEELEVVGSAEAAPAAETEAPAETETTAPETEAAVETETAAPETEAAVETETTAPETEAPTETETTAPAETEAQAETAAVAETAAPAETAAAETTVPETSTEAATETEMTEATTEETTEAATEETTEAATEETTEAATEETTEAATEEVTEETTEATTEAAAQETTGEVTYKTALSFENSEVVIAAKVSEKAQLPENAELHVEKLLPGSAKYEEAKQASIRDLGTAEDAEYNFYEVEFYADGEKIEVADGLATIRMTFKNVNVSGENQTQSALHIEETETGAVARDVTAEAEVGSAVGSVEFQF